MSAPGVKQQRADPRLETVVVLGASLAGLLTAAALAPLSGRVTVVERDPLPDEADAAEPDGGVSGSGAQRSGAQRSGVQRRGVPQGPHLHVLLPAGLAAIERLLPGTLADLQAAGAQLLDDGAQHRMNVGGGRVRLDLLGRSWLFVGATRPLIERVVRGRVLALANVVVRSGRRVAGLVPGGSGTEVSGVRLAAGKAGDPPETLASDLVVDATGRGSRMPQWLEEIGCPAPSEERLRVDVRYTTRLFRRQGPGPGGSLGVIVAPLPGAPRSGSSVAVEQGRWLVTLGGLAGEAAPSDMDGFRDYARSLWSRDLYDLVAAAEPLGDAITGAYPANARRRFERLSRLPERLVVVGDALCSTNPIYGRGITVAALEAETLARVLVRHGPRSAGRAFFRASRPVVDAAWTFVTSTDLLQPAIEGARPLPWRVMTAYSARVIRAAHRSPVVGKAFADSFGMLAAPSSLLRPTIALRALLARRPNRRGGARSGGTAAERPVLDGRTP